MGMQARARSTRNAFEWECARVFVSVYEWVMRYLFLFFISRIGTIALHLTIFIAYCINRDNNEKTDTKQKKHTKPNETITYFTAQATARHRNENNNSNESSSLWS